MNWSNFWFAYLLVGFMFSVTVAWRTVLTVLAYFVALAVWPVSFVLNFADWYSSFRGCTHD